jgi:hypothetical protein
MALAERGGASSLWIRDADRDRALCVLRCAPGGQEWPEVLLGAPVPLDSCAPGRVLAGADPALDPAALGAARVCDERGRLIAAVALDAARPADAAAVAFAGRIITDLIRDGVL